MQSMPTVKADNAIAFYNRFHVELNEQLLHTNAVSTKKKTPISIC